MNMKSGITKSHVEKPSQLTWLKHHMKEWKEGVLMASDRWCITDSSPTNKSKSKPRSTSRDSKRCDMELFMYVFL
jgi:hypothetical protein